MELVFVIVVIGILSMIAIPKFGATRDDAVITKAKTTVASIRSALSSEVQRRVLEGNYTAIQNLGGVINGNDKQIFDYFDGNQNNRRVLEYPPRSCKAGATGCWMRISNNVYRYFFPTAIGGSAYFRLNNNRFECTTPNSKQCRLLER
jgi:general secretion pathway protein G